MFEVQFQLWQPQNQAIYVKKWRLSASDLLPTQWSTLRKTSKYFLEHQILSFGLDPPLFGFLTQRVVPSSLTVPQLVLVLVFEMDRKYASSISIRNEKGRLSRRFDGLRAKGPSFARMDVRRRRAGSCRPRRLLNRRVWQNEWAGSVMSFLMVLFCGHFAPIFRKIISYARRCIVRRWFEVRWEVLTLAHRTVGQTLKSNHLEPIYRVLKLEDSTKLKIICQKSLQKILNYLMPRDFKRDQSSPKCSDLYIWPNFECAKVGTFQRTSNHRSDTLENLRGTFREN